MHREEENDNLVGGGGVRKRRYREGEIFQGCGYITSSPGL